MNVVCILAILIIVNHTSDQVVINC